MRLTAKYIKVVSVFLLLNMVNYIFFPLMSMALTAGPTAPDYTSFEPVDTNEMVDLSTGDFNYNIPVMEVPGPAGSFPFSLSYHAGIVPDQEASWVGLGWTLNPGAISRTVNGYADDYKNVQDVTRYFWEGGVTKSYSAGYSGSLFGNTNINVGATVVKDTYDGVKWYGNASVGMSLQLNQGIKNNYSVGVSSNKGVTKNINTSFGFGLGALTVDENQRDWNLNLGINLIGASMSSKSKGVVLSAKGFSASRSSNKSNDIRTKSKGFNLNVPLDKEGRNWLRLGYNKTRYWQDETEDVSVNGSLYFPEQLLATDDLEDRAYDSYFLVDQSQLMSSDQSRFDFRDTEFVKLNGRLQSGGSLPDYDSYSVTGQGIGGAIRPYLFKKHLLTQNKTSGDDEIYSIPTGFDTDPTGFRFIGDFSNSMKAGSVSTPDPGPIFNQGFVNGITIGSGKFRNDLASGIDSDGIAGYENNMLAGSRDVKYFNNSVMSSHAEIIDSDAKGFTRRTDLGNQIGGYLITNESGVKYHYSLPAYSYDEYQYTENINKNQEGDKFNELFKPEPYAYIWHLEAITGPDYVDRGPDGNADGKVNEYDWGYWVNFEYGKWTDQYFWRTPGKGMNLDLDNKFRTFSEGTKEIYYLNAIRTASHTAYFVKKVREDGKSSLKFLRNVKKRSNGKWKTHANGGITDENMDGGFSSKSLDNKAILDGGTDPNRIYYDAIPTKTLALDRIVLLENEALDGITIDFESGSYDSDAATFSWTKGTSSNWNGLKDLFFDQHLYENVLDVKDLTNAVGFDTNSLKSVVFNTDYSLVPKTPNSEGGKLTLNSLQTLGKRGASVLPSLKFGYEPEIESGVGNVKFIWATNKLEVTSPDLNLLKIGDLIKIEHNDFLSKTSYGIVEELTNSTLAKLKWVDGFRNSFSPGYIYNNAKFSVTKNPPYGKERYDNWGMYKYDFDQANVGISDPAAREVTSSSALYKDVWSLRSITSQLGSKIEIEYESDAFDETVTVGSQFFTVYDIVPLGNDQFKIILNENAVLSDYYKVGDQIDLASVYGYQPNTYYSCQIDGYGAELRPERPATSQYPPNYRPKRLTGSSNPVPVPVNSSDGVVSSVGTNYIIISSGQLTSILVSNMNRAVRGRSKVQKSTWNTGWADLNGGEKSYSAYYNIAPHYFFGGYVTSGIAEGKLGGDIRVSSITHITDSNNSATTRYSYSGGITSYLPFDILPAKKSKDAIDGTLPGYRQSDEEIENLVQLNSYNLYEPILANSRTLPGPGVNYRLAAVENETKSSGIIHDHRRKTEYEFRQLKPNDVSIIFGHGSQIFGQFAVIDYENVFNGKTVNSAEHRIINKEDRTSGLGQVLSIKDFGPDGLILKIENEYKTSSSIGRIDELFIEQRLTEDEGLNEFIFRQTETIDQYIPSYLWKQTTYDHKSGTKEMVANLAFDFYSGEVTTTYTEDGYGNKYVSNMVPAYRLENSTGVAYPKMGLALTGGKNMLTQEGASYSYMVSSDYNPDAHDYKTKIVGLVGASLQTWSDNNKVMDGTVVAQNDTQSTDIYRKKATYSFIGDGSESVLGGLFNVTQPMVVPLQADNTVVSSSWQKNAEITLYDVNSHALEAKDVNGNFAATKLDPRNERVLSTVANAKYEEFTASSFETAGEGNLQISGSLEWRDPLGNNKAHTGSMVLASTSTTSAISYDGIAEGARKYKVSFWSSSSDVKVKIGTEDVTTTSKGNHGGWYLMEAVVPVSDGSFTINVASNTGGTTYFDDFRVCPVDATMTSYVYNKWGELSHILDANNLYTEYKYDDMGRLESVTKETLKYGPVKTSEVDIVYSRDGEE